MLTRKPWEEVLTLHRFDPDRWTNPTSEMREHFQAFGGMARSKCSTAILSGWYADMLPACLGQNIARMELLHATAMFFKECPDARLVRSTNDESMDIVDFFVSKPRSGKCEITLGGEN